MQNEPQSNPNAIQPIHTFADDVEIARTHQHDSTVANTVSPVTIEMKRPRSRQPNEPVIQLANRGAKDYLSSDDTLSLAGSTPPSAPITKPAPTITQAPQPVSPKIQVGADAELAKEIATVAERPKKHSILSDTGVVHDASEGADLPTGTIIKDKKRQRSGLLATISASVRELFASTKSEPDEKIISTPPTVEAQPDKATTTSTPTPPVVTKKVDVVPVTTSKDDFKTVIETRQRKLTPTTDTALPIVKPVSETPDKSWSHYTNPNTHVEPEAAHEQETLPPLITKVPVHKEVVAPAARVAVAPAVSSTRQNIPNTPSAPSPTFVPPPMVEPAPTPEVKHVVETPKPFVPPPVAQAPVAPTPVVESVEPEPQEPAVPITPSVEPAPIIPIGEFAVAEQPYEAEEETTFEVVRPKVRADGIRLIPLELKNQKPVSRENQLALIMTIIIVAIGLGVIATIQFFGPRTEPNYTVTRPLPPAVLAIDAKIPVGLTTDRNDLLNDLAEIIEQENTLIQIYPTALSSRDREEPASATTILNTFAPRISGPFARTITDIAFGGSESAQPFIILRVMEFDTAFAGMIEWEKVMSADLAPLFGEAVTQSYNTQARAADGLLPATFVDTIIGNRSSRILFDATGAERITYTFVNQNTILITTNRTALEQLLPFVR